VKLILPRRDLIVPSRNKQGGFIINPYRYATTGGSGDPYFSNVVALLHSNGTNGSTTITDSSASAKTWTAVNGAAISTAQSKWGGSSIFFDGVNDHITSASHSDWAFGTSDFTVEAWIYFNAHTATATFLGNYTNSTTGWWLRYVTTSGGGLQFGYGDSGLGFGSFVPNNSQWYHIAWSRSGSTNRLFADGVQTGSDVNNAQNYASTAALYGGRLGALSSQFFSGYMDDIRITKGVARYTANFSVPTAAFPDS